MELSRKAIKEIAENLDCGMVCYINKQNNTIKSIIDPNDFFTDDGCWKEDMAEIEKNLGDYVKIEKMSSRKAYQIMEDFTEIVTDRNIRKRLLHALGRNRPFQKFKYEVDYDEDVRQQWFRYKAYRYEDWVRSYLEELGDDGDSIGTAQQISGYFNDDGTIYNPDLYPVPDLCLSCKKNNDPREEPICNLTRMDQQGEKTFECFAYERKEK